MMDCTMMGPFNLQFKRLKRIKEVAENAHRRKSYTGKTVNNAMDIYNVLTELCIEAETNREKEKSQVLHSIDYVAGLYIGSITNANKETYKIAEELHKEIKEKVEKGEL